MKSKLYSKIFKTPIGEMIALANENAIISFDFVVEGKDYKESKEHSSLLDKLKEELSEYFAGERKEFTLPLWTEGTEFQKGVWKTLLNIPYGTTISYKEEAKLFGNPKAIRAVASANGKNPISILIPCHRVISADGGLGGYTGGVWRKEFLLSLEKNNLKRWCSQLVSNQ